MNEKDYIAVGFSDLHLTLQPPQCRQEENWLAVQRGYLQQVKELAGKKPILFAGDLFDRWNPSPELIEFALRELPDGMYCVPGQHDLPNHAMELMHKSGYGVLKAADKIKDISGRVEFLHHIFAVEGCGWGQVAKGIGSPYKDHVRVLVAHRYIWDIKANAFPGVDETSRVGAYRDELISFNAALWGDNHRGFKTRSGNCSVLNNGTLIRRKADELKYRPHVGLLTKDGEWMIHELDTSADQFKPEADIRPEIPFNLRDLVEALNAMDGTLFDFREAVEQHLRSADVNKLTKETVLEAMQDGEID